MARPDTTGRGRARQAEGKIEVAVLAAWVFLVAPTATASSSLAATMTWLAQNLPARNGFYTAQGRLIHDFKYRFDGCRLEIEDNRWGGPYDGPERSDARQFTLQMKPSKGHAFSIALGTLWDSADLQTHGDIETAKVNLARVDPSSISTAALRVGDGTDGTVTEFYLTVVDEKMVRLSVSDLNKGHQLVSALRRAVKLCTSRAS